MDLLCEPSSPVAPPLKTPYVCDEVWDGCVFRAYPLRRGKFGLVPLNLRHHLGSNVPDEPYRQILYPSPMEEVQPFLQTWLWFGLLAEMLALNEISPGVRIVDRDTAASEIELLHKGCVVNNEDGSKSLTAKGSLDFSQMRQRIGERMLLVNDMTERLIYMRDCLTFANGMLNAISNLDNSVRYSIAALGELFSTGLFQAVARSNPKLEVAIPGFSWHQNYVKVRSVMATQMLQNGWCPSEIHKIRSQFQGLYTMHYTGQLKRPNSSQDHSQCTPHLCTAFQMDINKYRPLHVTSSCNCEHIGIGEDMATSILRYTDSYPIIRIGQSNSDQDDIELITEAYESSVPYVALSHVWANGLGNPRDTSLPKCQIKRIFQYLKALQSQVESQSTEESQDSPPPYRLWIDTLCCPVELGGKMIALERIADVYRNANHVLVLDASLTGFDSGDTHPAELLLRVYGASPWMRRLWTLQEGALTKSLYFQFADQAVNSYALLIKLYLAGSEDVRYTRIWQDVMNAYNELQGFRPAGTQSAELSVSLPPLISLQRAIHFRTVSVPSDEPLCISTLMGLDTKYIAAVQDAESRMARVWELLIRSLGTISARVIFFQDESLKIPGWRWAPRSLLSSSVSDIVMGIDERTIRFSGKPHEQGIPTSLGLKVTLPGCRLVPVPRAPGLPIHPWPDMINPTEDQIILCHEDTGTLYRVIDWYRSRKLAVWTHEERLAHDAKVDGPICRDIDTGRCALIYDKVENERTIACAMVLIEEGEHERFDGDEITPEEHQTLLRVRRTRTVILSPLEPEEVRMMEIVQRLANTVALDPCTATLLATEDREGELWKDRQSTVKQRMKEAIAEAWKADHELAQSVKNNIGNNLEEYMWVSIPKLFPHDTIMKELPKRQLWLID